VKKWLLLFSTLLFFNACGYKPNSYYAKKYLGHTIYADVKLFLSDPSNGIILKDAMLKALRTRFDMRISSKDKTKTRMILSMGSIIYIPMQYNNNGYVILYQAKLSLNADIIIKGRKQKFSVSGAYEFAVEPNSVLTDQVRFDAIFNSGQKALDSLLSVLAVKGLIKEKRKNDN
jgi:hypothetical protein